jgi:hypothetical protein
LQQGKPFRLTNAFRQTIMRPPIALHRRQDPARRAVDASVPTDEMSSKSAVLKPSKPAWPVRGVGCGRCMVSARPRRRFAAAAAAGGERRA